MLKPIRYVRISNVQPTNIYFIPLFEMYRELMDYDYQFIRGYAKLSVDRREQLTSEAFLSIDKLVLAKVDATLVGFIAVSHNDPEAISEMFVAEAYRKQGIGRALVTELKSMVKGPLKVNSVWGNEASLSFYKSMGFFPVTIGMTQV